MGASRTSRATTKGADADRADRKSTNARGSNASSARGSDSKGVDATADVDRGRNEVALRGRLAAPADDRELPSGDRIALLRLVVPRPEPARRRRDGADQPRRATVDTIDVVCWTAATRRTAGRLHDGDQVEVEGALRRRFFGSAGGRQSRYEVEASALRRVSGGGGAGT